MVGPREKFAPDGFVKEKVIQPADRQAEFREQQDRIPEECAAAKAEGVASGKKTEQQVCPASSKKIGVRVRPSRVQVVWTHGIWEREIDHYDSPTEFVGLGLIKLFKKSLKKEQRAGEGLEFGVHNTTAHGTDLAQQGKNKFQNAESKSALA